MSPIPDLPTELPDDVEIAPIASLPEDLDESDNPLMSLGAISHAESSTAAATRAREEQSQTLGEVGCASPAASPVVVEEARTRKRAKSPVDDTPTEQESESERDQTNAVDAGKPKRKYRKLKDIDGKPLRGKFVTRWRTSLNFQCQTSHARGSMRLLVSIEMETSLLKRLPLVGSASPCPKLNDKPRSSHCFRQEARSNVHWKDPGASNRTMYPPPVRWIGKVHTVCQQDRRRLVSF